MDALALQGRISPAAIEPSFCLQDVIRDAVFFQLRKHVQGALQEKPIDFDFATGGRRRHSDSSSEEDNLQGQDTENDHALPELEPMDTA